MKRRLMLTVFICLSAVVLYTGGPTACGGTACEDAYNKMKACVTNLTCSGATAIVCNAMKAAYATADYSASVAACEKATPGKCECTGAAATSAAALNACTLDAATCACKTT